MTSLLMIGLPENIDDKAISDTIDFRRNKVVAVRLARDNANPCVCLGYGFLGFSTPKDAVLAMSRYNGVKLLGYPQRLSLSLASATDAAYGIDNAQIYIGNLSEEVSDSDIYEAFKGISPHVTHCKLITSPTGQSLGFGFVSFSSREHAYRVVTASHNRPPKLGRYQVVVRETYQMSRVEIERGVDHLENTTIFCGNLHSSVSEDTLNQYFKPFGPIESVRLVPNRGFGFVSFVHHFSALAALSHMQNVDISGQSIHCMWGRMRPFGVDERSDDQYRTSAERFNEEWASSLIPSDLKPAVNLSRGTVIGETKLTDSDPILEDSHKLFIENVVYTWLCENST
jgi:RNA recognition motif-containing protein